MTAAPPSEPSLDLGAGRSQRVPGAIRLDRSREAKPDVVADVDRGALPFRSGCFASVGAFDVLEHVNNLVRVVEEVHRVLRTGGVLFITTPHFSSANAYTDPTHQRALGVRSFDFFVPGHELQYYSNARFRIRVRRLHFRGALLGRILSRFARAWPDTYESRLAWLFPAWFLYFELEKLG